jgi:capsule polysaccharide export protein KpsE/RkpR
VAVKIQDRIGVIQTNLDDLQSVMEAESRAIGGVQLDALKVDKLLARKLGTADLAGSLLRKTQELRNCLRDQRGALRELRQNMTRLRHELLELTRR